MDLIFTLNLQPPKISTKIVGGQVVTNQSQFAFIVSLQMNGGHFCAGSIIDEKHVLTAAHCCFDPKNKLYPVNLMTVAGGSLNIWPKNNITVIHRVKKCKPHRKYYPDNATNDIALIEISGSFQWSENLRPISLSRIMPGNETCSVAGWGTTKYNTSLISSQLLSVDIPIVETRRCKEYYGNQITSMMICAGTPGKDSCQGDSGGPLVCQGMLSGIVSWGVSCAIYPGVYTAVSEYKSWITLNGSNNPHFNKMILILIYLIMILF